MGSKRQAESVILGEMITLLARDAGVPRSIGLPWAVPRSYGKPSLMMTFRSTPNTRGRSAPKSLLTKASVISRHCDRGWQRMGLA